MIYDNLTNIGRYRGLHRNIDRAIDFLETTDLTRLEPGRYEVAGDEVFAFIQDNTLNTEPTDQFEYHNRYMDLQLLVEGNEYFRYTRFNQGVAKPFDEDSDIGFVISSEGYNLELDGTTFAMVFPGEAHQPNQFGRGGTQVKKCVVKILIN